MVLYSDTVTIPAGNFLMGACPDDKFANDTELPRRCVEIPDAFELGVYPVTVSEWRAFDPWHDEDSPGDLPVVDVSIQDIELYLRWLNSKSSGRPWRLPSEEEWEYACRAGTGTIFSFGDEIAVTEANFLFNESIERVGPGERTPVGAYPANDWGLHDMHGNVSEWTSSPWNADLHPVTEVRQDRYAIRGGAWDYLPRLLRSSWRDGLRNATRRDNLGFRLARSGS